MTFEISLALLLFVAMNVVVGLGWLSVLNNQASGGDSWIGQSMADTYNGFGKAIMFFITLLLYAVYGGVYWF